ASYDDLLPRAFWDPAARVDDLDRFGIDETVVFPNYGLLWERPIQHDLEATKVNMGAWNRWTVDMAAAGRGRLHPVAHLSLRDRAIHGVFARHPDLRLGIMELSAVWVPLYLLMLDGGFAFSARFDGKPLTQMELTPSEYVRRQVRVAAFGYERPDKLIRQGGDLFMFCSDFPHAEGLAQPLDDYTRMCTLQPDAAPALYSENLEWLLRR